MATAAPGTSRDVFRFVAADHEFVGNWAKRARRGTLFLARQIE